MKAEMRGVLHWQRIIMLARIPRSLAARMKGFENSSVPRSGTPCISNPPRYLAACREVGFIGVALFAALSFGCTQQVQISRNAGDSVTLQPITPIGEKVPDDRTQPDAVTPKNRRIEFAQYSPNYRFSAEIPLEWEVEYVPDIASINIYDPHATAAMVREKSQIFIRFFSADRFLTLSTVDILEREATIVKGHSAVRYEIEKKARVVNFPSQPSWRNKRHRLTDIRFAEATPSLFYVFAYRPEVQKIYDAFLSSLIFHNDRSSFAEPMLNSRGRITKKPFGIKISPDNSPVQPERFSGYHTAVDFEVNENERADPNPVRTFCGGRLIERKRASGYGGVVVQECVIEHQPVTVIYGHLAVGSVTAKIGDYLLPGRVLGYLGADKSAETDGEREHLHFGIHKGSSVDIRGYVPNESQLAQWINPLSVLP